MNNETINGKFVTMIYQDETTSFTVAKFEIYDAKESLITVTGTLPNIYPNILYRLEGEYRNHVKYGSQFVVSAFEKVLPTDYDSIISFLSSPLFPGIGEKAATKIVDTLGINCIEMIRDNNTLIESVKGLSKKARLSIIEGINENHDLEKAISFFSNYGLGIKNIMKMDKFYGKDLLKKVQTNPYCLIEDIDGIGFKTVDKLAAAMDFDMTSEYRTNMALYSLIMDLCMQNGDTYIHIETLEVPLVKRLGHNKFNFDEALKFLVESKKIFIEQNRVYHATQYIAEIDCAAFLKNINLAMNEEVDINQANNLICKIEENEGIVYENLQKKAIISFLENNFTVLTGGPGTGKTTIVKGMLKIYTHLYPFNSIALCAPTGRAAKRLSELTGIEATTIHRLLKWNLETNTFAFNCEEPLNIDLLVIDEFSMVDNWLFHQIILACKNVKKVVVVGDEHQLPPVACGSVLRDIIESNCFNVVRLTKIYRQAEGSDVVKLAECFNNNTSIDMSQLHEVKFYDCVRYDVRYLVIKLVELAFERGFDINDIQVLAPKYNGNGGIDDLNRELQVLCNPFQNDKKQIKVGNRIFREGDKILQLKNQPEDDVYNGDIGILEEVILAEDDVDNKNHIIVNFDGNIVVYSSENFINITHAYAISIHKSQGSEYQIVIMPIISDYYYMLSKKLIYTGITRAKKSLILLGSKSLFNRIITENKDYERNTTLRERIIANFNE